MTGTRRRIALAAAAFAVLASSAFCTAAQAATGVFARITLHQSEGSPGGMVSGTGEGFDHWSSEAVPQRIGGEGEEMRGVWTNAGPVRIHWNAVEGAVVWEGSPGLDGEVSFSFHVPQDAAPGEYTVVATQTGYDGKPSGGTPARATFRVVAPRPRPLSAVARLGRAEAVPAKGDARLRARRTGRSASRKSSGGGAATPREGDSGTRSPAARPTAGTRAAGKQEQRSARTVLQGRTPDAATAAGSGQARSTATVNRAGIQWYLIALGLAAGGIAGAGGAVLVIRRRRPGPAPEKASAPPLPPDRPAAAKADTADAAEVDALEIELQQLLADERADQRALTARQ